MTDLQTELKEARKQRETARTQRDEYKKERDAALEDLRTIRNLALGGIGHVVTPMGQDCLDAVREDFMWHPMEDGPPSGSKNGGWYYVQFKSGERAHGLWNDDQWFGFDVPTCLPCHYDEPVTHWRLLPEPPKDVDDG